MGSQQTTVHDHPRSRVCHGWLRTLCKWPLNHCLQCNRLLWPPQKCWSVALCSARFDHCPKAHLSRGAHAEHVGSHDHAATTTNATKTGASTFGRGRTGAGRWWRVVTAVTLRAVAGVMQSQRSLMIVRIKIVVA